MSKNYHNMAARYNCYFLAKEKMLEVEEKLFENHTDDYNYILSYYPTLDTTFNTSLETDLNYIFEKALLPINNHKNSNWLAESYNIIGRTKLLGNRIDTAIYVHKYVIAKTNDLPGKQNAQISLLRTYVSQGDMRSAEDEYYQLQTQKIFDENQKENSLAALEYHYYLREFHEMLPHLDNLVPLVKNKDLRARLRFIKGQIHQRNGNNEEAFAAYKKSLKRNPPYEIEFNAKLNLSQVTDIDSKDQIKKINKYYDKMLTDDKNTEYQGRIYYERAKFELKQNHLSKGVRLLNKSLDVPGTPQDQKSYAYLLLGKLHYNDIDTLPSKVDKYKAAQLYYDSTVTSMSPRFENAEQIIERQVILNNFVDQLKIIEKEEQLQAWAQLSPEELALVVEEQMAIDKARLEKEAAIKRKRAEQAKNNNNTFEIADATGFSEGGFFAFDPIAVASHKLRFEQKWNNRVLEDNWRRSNKETIDNEFEDSTEEIDSLLNDSTSIVATDTSDQIEEIKLDKGAYTANLPTDYASITASNNKLIEAYYKLGKIYYYDLEEIENAQETFELYVEKFPGSKYEAEVIYFLYLICQKSESCNPTEYKDLEQKKYPNSLFYKLMENKDYLSENESMNKESHNLYEQSFNSFKAGNYLVTRRSLNKNKQLYPKSDILDKIAFLEISTYAYTDQLSKYYYELDQFTKDFGTSPLKLRAQEILKTKPNNIIASNKVDTTYNRVDSIPHYFVAMFKPTQMPFDKINTVYKEFRQNYYRDVEISTKRIDFSDTTYLLVNRQFEDYKTAKTYLDKLMHHHDFGKHLEKTDYSYYLVTEKNYKTLLATRNINGLDDFYRKQYGTK